MTQLTRTHITFFEDFAKQFFREQLEQTAGDDVDVEHILSMIDYKDYAKRFGAVALEHASYSDLKYADKVLKDERVVRASTAINHAILTCLPSTEEELNIGFIAQMLASKSDPDDLFSGIADAPDEVREAALVALQARLTAVSKG
ncbi:MULTISPECIES: hypothetical protein [unclassified Pseudomonas]|uniref:DUF7375 domain-containing protein n=1 Tax=unclassified Pseudomonas TaxID=196821 RepID=UPI000871A410|nr:MULTISPECIES: hypothetical protein [unclassified Pseudomonas]SCW76232.1 hypothetical protein SAMN03159424_03005 [Pseudomonas sp. NFACC05-1]SEI69517.1 hypothetical protein SAMN03159298_01085 [Pseudomonas sp. NFACC07-1]